METSSSLPRLRFLCRRGMKESEEILHRFLDERYDHLDDKLQQDFADLLNCEDTELWDWIVIKKDNFPDNFKAIIEVINAA